jgi:hypothetical protein
MIIKNVKFLESELRKLEKSTCYHNNKELGIIWIPKTDAKKEGEVIGNTIYVYSTSSHMALETLRHEFFDLIVSNAIKPYMNLVNALLSVIGESAYKNKEETVESLLLLCQSTANEHLAS